MFNESSFIVQSWVHLIKSGRYIKEQVPNVSNLREQVNLLLEKGE